MTPDSTESNDTSLVVVMPAHNAEATVGECLDALIAAGFPRDDITVIDDGSDDRTGDIVRARGVRLFRNETAQRPAEARNRGAALAGGDAIMFVDSDVRVAPDVRARILHHLNDPRTTGVIGSYDDAPRSQSVVGRYRNLLHAFTHQNSAGEIPTFWTGLGVVRRKAFEAAGGFLRDWESIEDVELGLKLTSNGGRVLLDPDIKGKHLKDWTLGSMFRTDMFGRAAPWTRLLRSGRMPMGVLSTTLDKRISTGAVALATLSLLASLFSPVAFLIFLISMAVFVAANLGLLAYLAQNGGLWFALRCVPLHAIHQIAGLLGYTQVMLLERGASKDG